MFFEMTMQSKRKKNFTQRNKIATRQLFEFDGIYCRRNRPSSVTSSLLFSLFVPKVLSFHPLEVVIGFFTPRAPRTSLQSDKKETNPPRRQLYNDIHNKNI